MSKYLAVPLFIILPFIGGYIGYVWAPEKLVVVEVGETIEQQRNEFKIHEEKYLQAVESIRLDKEIVGKEIAVPKVFSQNPQFYRPLFSSIYGDIYASSGNKLLCANETVYFNEQYNESVPFILLGTALGFSVIGDMGSPGGDSLLWIQAKNSDAVYFNCESIRNADPATYEIVTAPIAYHGGHEEECSSGCYTMYATDKSSVYFRGKEIPGADPASFSLNVDLSNVFHNEAERMCPNNSCPYVVDLANHLQLGKEITSDTSWLSLYEKYSESLSYDASDTNNKYFLGRVVE